MNLSWGGGDKPCSRNGDKCQMGGVGIGKIFSGAPSPPQEKNPVLMLLHIY